MIKTHIAKRIEEAIEQRVFPGCAIGYMKGGLREELAFGKLTYENDSRLVNKDTIYDIASVTKAIPTASLLLKYIDEGKANIGDYVSRYLPEFGNTAEKRTVTLRHLLTYTLDLGGIARMSALRDKSPDSIIKTILEAPTQSTPGAKFVYTNTTAGLMGLVVEKIGGKKLPELASEIFFEPLKMTRTTFSPKQFGLENIAPTEIDEWRRRTIQGEVHDESAYAMSKKMAIGSAGLFSMMPDILNFLEMLLGYGAKNNQRYFSEPMVREMYTNQIAGIGECAGLGWELNQPWFMGNKDTLHTFGKTGFTGCVVMINAIQQTAVVILSNRTYPKRPVNSSASNKLRADIANILFD
jgi:CubicO group peptidase (beta-lactamase class C family)